MTGKTTSEHGAALLARKVYALLADRGFHSGATLARACGVSRSAIWKAVTRLRELGVQVDAVANRGYRLPEGGPLLDVATIRRLLPAMVLTRLREGLTVWSLGSTNAELLQRPAVPPGRFDFMTAEYQSAGRGRRARRWYAPPGGALCLSLSWTFAALPPEIGALSLAMGVCVMRALAGDASREVALKWPNDLVVGQAKLGGILTELRAEAAGPATVVIGIGLNVALGAGTLQLVEASGTRATDLASLGGDVSDRNVLAAAVIGACVAGLEQFEQNGFRSFVTEWCAADALAGQPIIVSGDQGKISGHARGIDLSGALCVQTRMGLQRFICGEVSVRASP